MNKVQIIRDARGKEAFAVLPWDDYKKLRAGPDEDATLIARGETARADEVYPAQIAKRLAAGEVPLKVIREWRGLTQAALGASADVPTQYISQIERGERNVGRKTAAKLAPVLEVSADILLD